MLGAGGVLEVSGCVWFLFVCRVVVGVREVE